MQPVNYLENLDSFEQILPDYHPSIESIATLQSTPLVVLVGPTAAGRNTLISILVHTGRYHFIVSDTTRHPRENNGILEQSGREYWFKSEVDFLEGLQAGAYLEAAIIHKQQVSGISISELTRASKQGVIAICEVQPDGAEKIQEYSPNKLIIFLLPPTFDIWMERLHARGNMTKEELKRRLESAQDEISRALQKSYYQFVINNEIHEAAQAVDELANGRIPDIDKQNRGRQHAEQLAIDVQIYLKGI